MLCISCQHGVKTVWCGFCSHFCVSLTISVAELCNILSKEHTKCITKQCSLPGKIYFILVFLVWALDAVFQWFHRHSTRPRKNLPFLKSPRIRYLSPQHTNCSVSLRGRRCKTPSSHLAAQGDRHRVTAPSQAPDSDRHWSHLQRETGAVLTSVGLLYFFINWLWTEPPDDSD